MPGSPNDSDIEEALRNAVQSLYEAGNVTVKLARAAAEEQLGLDDGFLKSDGAWKNRSSEIIKTMAAELQESPVKPTTTAKAQTKPTPSKKRSKGAVEKPSKRRKRESSESEHDPEEDPAMVSDSGLESPAPAKTKPLTKQRISATKKPQSDSSELSEHADVDENSEDDNGGNAATNNTADSESELSDVIDEPAPRRKRTSGAAKTPKQSGKAAKAKPKKTGKDAELPPDETEIKRLQSWLVKCGIRKLWGKELKPYETNKAKIKHLKGMLEDAGMTGRYSNEKASAIKEARELAADLEAVKEGNKQWGEDKAKASASDESEEDAPPPPPRRSVTSRFVDFGDEDSDEE
ncbi:HIRA-interacting protein 3 [Sphaceloma murrayae]|uniref:HIRA-interacting protein 3 n=1 Tax=Sphaceloma murrayae TaxID=2082308 RepID=A0A2K1R076_9PEZI|nr:HIRA-interacting protein 3 [Sphaceloma murrayae]